MRERQSESDFSSVPLSLPPSCLPALSFLRLHYQPRKPEPVPLSLVSGRLMESSVR